MHAARRVVVINGAGGALGAALASQFACEPNTDLVLSDVSERSLRATVEGLASDAAPVASMVADVSDISGHGWTATAISRYPGSRPADTPSSISPAPMISAMALPRLLGSTTCSTAGIKTRSASCALD